MYHVIILCVIRSRINLSKSSENMFLELKLLIKPNSRVAKERCVYTSSRAHKCICVLIHTFLAGKPVILRNAEDLI